MEDFIDPFSGGDPNNFSLQDPNGNLNHNDYVFYNQEAGANAFVGTQNGGGQFLPNNYQQSIGMTSAPWDQSLYTQQPSQPFNHGQSYSQTNGQQQNGYQTQYRQLGGIHDQHNAQIDPSMSGSGSGQYGHTHLAQQGVFAINNQSSTQPAPIQYGMSYQPQNSHHALGSTGQMHGQARAGHPHPSQSEASHPTAEQPRFVVQPSVQPNYTAQQAGQPGTSQRQNVQNNNAVQSHTVQQGVPQRRAAPARSSTTGVVSTTVALPPTKSQTGTANFWGASNMTLTSEKSRMKGKTGHPVAFVHLYKNLWQHLGRSGPLPVERINHVISQWVKDDPEGNKSRRTALDKEFKEENIVPIPATYNSVLDGGRKKKPKKGAQSAAPNLAFVASASAGLDLDDDDPSEVSDDGEEEDRPDDPIDAAVWDARQIPLLPSGPEAFEKMGETVTALLTAVKDTANTANGAIEEEKLVRVLDEIYRDRDKYPSSYGWLLGQMGQHPQVLVGMFSRLNDYFKAKKLGGRVALAILRWLSLFKSFDPKAVEKVDPKRRVKVYLKQNNTSAEELLKKIQQNLEDLDSPGGAGAPAAEAQRPVATTTTAATTQSRPTTKTTNAFPTTKPQISPSKEHTTTSSALPSKRSLEDSSSDRSAKKIALTPGPSSSSTKPTKQLSNTVRSSPTPAATAQASSLTSANRPVLPSAGGLPGKARPLNKPTVKPETINSMGNKSTTGSPANAPKAGASKNELPKPAASKIKKTTASKAPPASGSSKLGALLEEISKPKEQIKPAAAAKAAKATPETPEERAKRLRKESRRSLRVRFKEGDALTQVKIFETDESEHHTGAQDKAMRVEEGKALKDAQAKAKTMGTSEEDDDGVEKPWQSPNMIDLSNIPESLKARTFETRGGNIYISTPDQAAMKKREDTVLMEIYTDPNDIPPTPKSPVLGSVDPIQNAPAEITSFPAQDPRFQEVQQRWHESHQYGTGWAAQAALTRVHAKKAAAQATAQARPSQAAAAPTYSGSASDEVLRLLLSDACRNPNKPTIDPANLTTHRRYDYVDPEFQKVADNIEDVCAQFKDEPAVAQKPPAWITDPARIEEWWKGFNRDNERKTAEKKQQEAAKLAVAQNQAQAAAVTNPQETAGAWHTYFSQHHAYNQGRDIPADYQASYQYWLLQQQQSQPVQSIPAQQTPDGVQNLLAALGGNVQPAQAQPQPTANGIQNLLAALGGNAQAQQATTTAAPQYGAAAAAAPNLTDPAALLQYLSAHQAGNNQVQQGHHRNQGSLDHGRQQDFGYDGSTREQHDQDRGYGQQDQDRGYGDQDRGHGQHQQHQHGGRGNKRESRDYKNSRDSRDNRDSRGGGDDSHLRGINRNLIGTKQCTFYLQGKCVKGDKCTFRHD